MIAMRVDISVIDGMYFVARSPCGKTWTGMRHSNDVRVYIDAAMDHVAECPVCAPPRPAIACALCGEILDDANCYRSTDHVCESMGTAPKN